jgi:hypothetical protein
MSTSYNEAKTKSSKYWRNKPIMKINDRVIGVKQIQSDSEIENNYRHDNWTKLPTGYSWEKIDICDYTNMTKVCVFLSEHYKRGSNSEYIIKYDVDRINWEMCHKGYFMAVIDNKNNIIGVVGFTFRTVQLLNNRYTCAEPMYMCCSKKYKGTGISKVLIDEITRQSLLMGINKGIICNNRIVSRPVATIRQYSRPLNYKKLREYDFIDVAGVDDDIVHTKTKINLKPNRRYVVAEKTQENIDLVYALYTQYMESFNLHMVLTKSEIENYMFDDRYVKTIIVMSDEEPHKPVDFISYNFYDIVDTNIELGNDNIIKTANILMYSSNVVRSDLLFINILKQISFDKIHIVYINDMMHSNEAILSNIKNADEDTDDEEENAAYDMNIVKTRKKTFINLYNIECESLKQNMVSWLIF